MIIAIIIIQICERDFLKSHLPSQMKNPSQQLISSGDKRRKRGCSCRHKNPPILIREKKGDGADTSHY